MRRKLFCEISPLTYAVSRKKCIVIRSVKNLLDHKKLARTKQTEELEHLTCAKMMKYQKRTR